MFLLTALFAWPASAAEVRLKSTCHAASPLVVLGDVADVVATGEAEAKTLKEIELFPAPAAGRLRRATSREIYELLELRSVNLVDCRLSGARTILIYGTQEPEPDAAPAMFVASKAAPIETPAASPPELELVVMAARPLRRGDVLTPEDVTLQPAPGRADARDTVQSVGDVTGLELTRSLGAGQPIDPSQLRTPLLVRRGETVSVLVDCPGVRVRTVGRAMQDGSQGEEIFVQRLDDRRQFAARVSGPQTVEAIVPP